MSDAESWIRAATDPEERKRRIEGAKHEMEKEGVIVAASEAKGERELLLARAFRHPRDEHIRFQEDIHKYFLRGKMLPISVTGFYGRFFDHFRENDVLDRFFDKWAAKPDHKYYPLVTALTEMKVPKEKQKDAIKLAWKLNGTHQSSLGTALHRMIELTLNLQPEPPITPEEPVELPQMEDNSPLRTAYDEFTIKHRLTRRDALRVLAFMGLTKEVPEPPQPSPRKDVAEYKFFEEWLAKNEHLWPVRTEMNVWSEEHQLAGQLDALMYDSKEGVFLLVDWKRSKTMEYEAFGDRRGKPPFQDIPDTNYGHYTVQQGCYSWILKRYYGIEVKRMVLLQLHPDYDAAIEHEVDSIEDKVDIIMRDRAKEVLAEKAKLEGYFAREKRQKTDKDESVDKPKQV